MKFNTYTIDENYKIPGIPGIYKKSYSGLKCNILVSCSTTETQLSYLKNTHVR